MLPLFPCLNTSCLKRQEIMMKVMNTSLNFELRPGETVSLKCHQEQRLAVDSVAGRNLWLTRQGDGCDYWLGAGDAFDLRPGDKITLSVEKSGLLAKISIVSAEQTSSQPQKRQSSGRASIAAIANGYGMRSAAAASPAR
ncbi:MAG: DUF2917 domain-containing protein [Noviherbaspirillum sp.]